MIIEYIRRFFRGGSVCGGGRSVEDNINDGLSAEELELKLNLEKAEKECTVRRMNSHIQENIIVEDFSHRITEFYDFNDASVLGSGCNGTVRSCVHKQTKIHYAIKTLKKTKVNPSKIDALRQEIRLMAEIDHPNIITLQEVFESNDVIYLVLELCDGGELLTRLNNQPHHHFSEDLARKYVKTMSECIAYLHDKGIVHRDIKLENFVFEDDSNESELKLIDFGLSKHFTSDEAISGAVGTPFYVAPEVLSNSYSEKCDVWSVGVLAYMLLCGHAPFDGEDDRHTLELVKKQPLSFQHKAFSTISRHAISFITQSIQRKVELRPSARQLLNHPWFNSTSLSSVNKSSVSADIVSKLATFGRHKLFVQIALGVLAHTLTNDQIVLLRKQFSEFDSSRLGVLRQEDLQRTLQRFGCFVSDDVNSIFRSIDMDHDLCIRFHEFIAAAMPLDLLTDANYKAAFLILSKHDADYIRIESIRELLGADSDEEHILMALREVGINADAPISFEQFKAIVVDNCADELDV